MEKKDLKPAGVFKYFEEICQVPRPSKKEEKMIAYLKAFGAKHNLETKVDEAGNVLIKKPATPGKENLQTVVLQSHIDMVCEKSKGWTDTARNRDVRRTKPHTGTHKPLAMATLVALRRADAHSCRQPPARRQQRRAVTNLRHRHPVYGLCLCHTPHHHLADSLFFYKLKLVTVSLRLRDTILLSN